MTRIKRWFFTANVFVASVLGAGADVWGDRAARRLRELSENSKAS